MRCPGWRAPVARQHAPRDAQRLGIVALRDQLTELGRAGDIRPLADVDEDGAHRNLLELGAGEGLARVTVRNPGKSIAFFIRLQVTGRGGEEALPVLWEDNYFALMPGEKRQVLAKYRSTGKPIIEVDGWNVVRKAI